MSPVLVSTWLCAFHLLRFLTQIIAFHFYERLHLSLLLPVILFLCSHRQSPLHQEQLLASCSSQSAENKTKSFLDPPKPKSTHCLLPPRLFPDHQPLTCCCISWMLPSLIASPPRDPARGSSKPLPSPARLTDTLIS